MSTIEKIQKAIDEFEATCIKYSELGGQDTEPEAYFQWLLMQAASGYEWPDNHSPDKWSLYDEPGSKVAAKVLHRKAKKIFGMVREIGQIHQFLNNYCWRVYT